MSDQPRQTDNPNGDIQPTGGWRQPEQPGAWRVVAPAEEAVEAQVSVPTLPANLDEQPADAGGWHLPAAADTPFTPQDQTTIVAPEDELPKVTQSNAGAASAGAASADATAAPPMETAPSPEDLMATVGAPRPAEPAPEPTSEPEPEAPRAPEDIMYILDSLDDDNEFDTFSMSELVALASLVDEEPRDGVTAPAAPSAQTTAPADPNDPAAYARQQLAQLEDAGDTAIIDEGAAAVDLPTLNVNAPPDTSDPGAYARQQLEQLEGSGSQTPVIEVAPQAPALDPRQEELARRYVETEEEVRALKRMAQSGQISQEELQEQLRQLMILDDNGVWWMMGVETDTWYRYENNEWVPGEPPRIPSQTATADPGISGSETVRFDTQGNTLSYLDTQEQPGTQGEAPDEIRLDENYMPLPRSVPTVDPEQTVVSPAYLDDVRPGEQATVANPNMEIIPAGATIPMQPAAYNAGTAIESPLARTDPPAVGLDVAEAPLFEEAQAEYQSRLVRNLIFAGLTLLAVLFAVGVFGVFAVLSWYNGVLDPYRPQIANLANYEPPFQTVRILDYQGDEIATLTREGDERIEVDLSEISPFLIHAVLSSEDPDFYTNPGWSQGNIVSLFFQSVLGTEPEFENSTITQQLAERLILGTGDTRAEALVAVSGEITNQYDKNRILELYLNEFYFGNQIYGVEAASQFYFDKSASELNIAESALLAAILQDPGTYDPVTQRELTFDRMDEIVVQMGEVGCLPFTHGEWAQTEQPFCVTTAEVTSPETTTQRSVVKARRYLPRTDDRLYPHFINLVEQQLIANYGDAMYSQGFVVRTTLVPELQEFTEEQLQRRVRQLLDQGVQTGAVVYSDPQTGAIRAYVGSPDYYDEERNGQQDFPRTYHEPGTSILPAVYALALRGVDINGNSLVDLGEYYTPATLLWDVPTSFNDYTPPNFDSNFQGPVSVRQALVNAYSVPAVRTYQTFGENNFRELALDMGLEFVDGAPFSPGTAIGTTEVRLYDLMELYGVIANGGIYRRLYVIQSITDAAGNDIPLAPDISPTEERVLPEEVAYLLQDILSNDGARDSRFGRGGALTVSNLENEDFVGALPGTGPARRDLWSIGFTNTDVVGVWLGRPDEQTLSNAVTGYNAAAPLWQVLMRGVVDANPREATRFTPPDEIVTLQVCALTGVLASAGCPTTAVNEVFWADRPPPPAQAGLVVTDNVHTWNGLRVSEFCNVPEDTVAATFVSLDDQAALSWLTNTPEGRAAAQRLGLPQPVLPLPPACDQSTVLPTAVISSPAPNQEITTTEFTITGQASALATEFGSYQIEYYPANNPNAAALVAPPSQNQVSQPGAPLALWNLVNVPNGTYILRLRVISNDGGYVTRTVPVTVNKPQPTATPTPTPTNTPEPTQAQPIPFDPLGTPIPVLPGSTPIPFVPGGTPIPFDEVPPANGVIPTTDPFALPTPTTDFGAQVAPTATTDPFLPAPTTGGNPSGGGNPAPVPSTPTTDPLAT